MIPGAPRPGCPGPRELATKCGHLAPGLRPGGSGRARYGCRAPPCPVAAPRRPRPCPAPAAPESIRMHYTGVLETSGGQLSEPWFMLGVGGGSLCIYLPILCLIVLGPGAWRGLNVNKPPSPSFWSQNSGKPPAHSKLTFRQATEVWRWSQFFKEPGPGARESTEAPLRQGGH